MLSSCRQLAAQGLTKNLPAGLAAAVLELCVWTHSSTDHNICKLDQAASSWTIGRTLARLSLQMPAESAALRSLGQRRRLGVDITGQSPTHETDSSTDASSVDHERTVFEVYRCMLIKLFASNLTSDGHVTDGQCKCSLLEGGQTSVAEQLLIAGEMPTHDAVEKTQTGQLTRAYNGSQQQPPWCPQPDQQACRSRM